MAAKKPRHPNALTLDQALDLSRIATPVGEFVHQTAPTRYRAAIISTVLTPGSTMSVEHSMLYHDGDITYTLCTTAAGHRTGTYHFFTDDRGRHYHGSPTSDVRVRDAYEHAKAAWQARCKNAELSSGNDTVLEYLDDVLLRG
ncbi:TPA: hypothetical protein HA251_04360 [Candidatus Woesearchaeota archaeon]|nr:hypothetical protein [Candidatus Woesearchaeota archaeon]